MGERHGKWKLQAVILAFLTPAFTTSVPPHMLMSQVHTDFPILFALIIHVGLQTLLLRVTHCCKELDAALHGCATTWALRP